LSIAFETPQEYIAILQELAQRYGDPNGNISRNIERLHCVAQLRASGQTVESLPPDPASAPPEKLPIDRPFQNSNDAAHFDAPDPQSPNSPRLPLLGRPPSPPAPPTLQTLPPQQGIVLKIKRSQRLGPLGGNIYMLDARIDASAEIRAIILKHRLGNRVIYESRSRKKRAEATLAHLEKSQESTSGFPPPSAPLQGTGGALLHLGRAAVSAGIGAFSLHVTIDKLFSGIHIECKSMEELLDAEQAVKQAKENLLKCIDLISTFDGREEII
jgi:hypothetical protein